MLKDAAVVMSTPLSHVINLSLTTGTFPMDWGTAKINVCTKVEFLTSLEITDQFSILLFVSKITEKEVLN